MFFYEYNKIFSSIQLEKAFIHFNRLKRSVSNVSIKCQQIESGHKKIPPHFL